MYRRTIRYTVIRIEVAQCCNICENVRQRNRRPTKVTVAKEWIEECSRSALGELHGAAGTGTRGSDVPPRTAGRERTERENSFLGMRFWLSRVTRGMK